MVDGLKIKQKGLIRLRCPSTRKLSAGAGSGDRILNLIPLTLSAGDRYYIALSVQILKPVICCNI